MKMFLLPLVLLGLVGRPASAMELAGVRMDDEVSVEGKVLRLNGLGLRTKFIFKVYVGGLYLEAPLSEATQVIAADQTKRVRLHMLRDLDKETIAKAIRTGFQANAGERLPALQQRLDVLVQRLPDLKKGQTLEVTYAPGKGTALSSSAGATAAIDGKDFADALFSVWFGAAPVDEGLRRGMLGAR